MAGVVVLVLLVASAFKGPDERAAVQAYARAWERGDTRAMHRLLTGAAKGAHPYDDFAARQQGALATATATKVATGTPRKAGEHSWRLPVRVETKAFGPVRGVVAFDVADEDGEARLDWHPEDVFPGLARGERLKRTTRMPDRADLLARDGTALAEGTERTSTLGAAAEAIVGTVGPVPKERAAEVRRRGLPTDAQIGLTGLERIFEERLAGTPGGELRAGLRLLAKREPRKAQPVRTTLDVGVQTAAVASLAGRLGGVVALDPRNGEVLGVAGIGFSGLQPPGSTFKIITLAAALDAGVAKPSDTFPVQTAATLSGVELENANGEACGGTLAESFAESCNSVFAPMGAKLGAKRLVAAAERFGFNTPPGIVGAATSTIPPAEEIGDDLAVGSSAIGQGRVQASALQMALVAATIARRGKRPAPTLDLEAAKQDAPTTTAVPASVARRVGRMMTGVVNAGTGTSAAIPGVTVAGKTGTAELRSTKRCEPDPSGVGGSESCPADQQPDPTDTTAWFAAYAPAGDRQPRVAVGLYVVGAGAGGETAAPAAKQVLLAALKR
ncbi:MAG: hypothetical protein HZB46_01910 [Solirubrobacterales bacterium]|nr:hypothetical protein [Solirubrobacterales bacterium]